VCKHGVFRCTESFLCPALTPNLTPCDFFLWGYVKDRVYVPSLLGDLPELRLIIMDAVASIDVHMLERVWQELDYRIDVLRVTKGGHIEHL
jgi:hypothetical protein